MRNAQTMVLTMIAAMAKNRVIGRDGDLPWRLPADLKHFKRVTMGHPMIMGRKTFDSIGRKPLPGRPAIVVTRKPDYVVPDGVRVVHSFDDALAAVADAAEAFVAGGAEIYRAAMPHADRIHLTEIDLEVEGDTWFPELDPAHWREASRAHHEPDEKNAHPYDFVLYERGEPR